MIKLNSAGFRAAPGARSGPGGDTNMSSRHLYYCGRQLNQCRCGFCDGCCGPNNGCPCRSCVELVGFKVNSDNVIAKKGQNGGSGGVTGVVSHSLYYCGRRMYQCRCGRCDGRCGPDNGCPCRSCLDLVDLKVNSSGDLCRRGGSLGSGGDTGKRPQDLYYCGNDSRSTLNDAPSNPSTTRNMSSTTKLDDDASKEGTGQCQICCDKKVNSVVIPCGHMSLCYDCAVDYHQVRDVKECIICRNPCTNVMRTFMC